MQIVIKKKKIAKNSVLFCMTLVLCFMLLEAGFRIFAPQPLYDKCTPAHPQGIGRLSMSDNLLGHTTRPNLQGCLYQPDTNKKIKITTNNKGQRTKQEYAYKKPQNTTRILLFGDSFILADMLDDTQTFQVKLQEEIEKILKQKYKNPPAIEVIPFGMGSYGTQQSYLTYFTEGKKYEFDVALYLFYQNDVTDSFISSETNYPRPVMKVSEQKAEFATARQVFEGEKTKDNQQPFALFFNEQNVPIPHPSWHKRFFLAHSHLFSFADRTIAHRQSAKEEKDSEFNRLVSKVALMDDQLIRLEMKKRPKMQEMIPQVSAIIGTFNYEVKKANAQFVLINIPSVYQAQTRFRQRIVEGVKQAKNLPEELEYMRTKNEENLFGAPRKNVFLDGTAERYDIPYIDLLPIAEKYENTFYFKTDDHWSPVGAAVSAQYVAKKLDALKLLSHNSG
ncbi:MAG: hypothetical protein Q7R76_03780 [Candidatus Woesearchaeota archaeon]|nr:hypothetical protein [Candidatus Woesearchaeota archaeon]